MNTTELRKLAKELMTAHNEHSNEGPTAFSEAASELLRQVDEVNRLTAERDALRADARRYKHLRDDCFRVSINGIMFVSVPNKWLSEHQTTTSDDDAAIDAAMKGQP